MNRNVIISLLVIALLALGGAVGWLMIGQQELEAQVGASETAVAEGEATLVAVFAQQRTSQDQSESTIATADAEIAQLQAAVTAVAPLIATEAAVAGQPTPTPAPTEIIDPDAPPQVRIRLEERDPVKVVGEPIKIIASASHPLGIASLNILVNGETILVGDPFDPRMDIVITNWTPLETGSYQIAAVATTIRGRASDPVIIEIDVVESAEPEARLDVELRTIEENVRDIRGLEQQGEINVNLISQLNLQESITVDLFDDFTREDAERDVIVLSAFDFMPRNYNLYDSLIELYGFAIAGYYDEETDSLYVVTDDLELNAEERLTHAHEYMHALQDQYFTLADIQNGTLDSDATLALRALAEGEASLVEFVYRTGGYLTGEQNADSDPVIVIPESIPSPNLLVSQLAFPYIRGQEFLAPFYEDGGFAAVSEVWQRPPASTEQILHLDKYLAQDDPIQVELPAADILAELGDGWSQLADDVFGEFYLIEWLSLALAEDVVNPAAGGWGGDRYAVFYNAAIDERVMVLEIVWDDPADLDEFIEAFGAWAAIFLDEELPAGENGERCWRTFGNEQCLLITADSAIVTRSDSADLRQRVNEIMLR